MPDQWRVSGAGLFAARDMHRVKQPAAPLWQNGRRTVQKASQRNLPWSQKTDATWQSVRFKELAMSHHEEEIRMLRDELELLMGERQQLLQVVGAVASLIASLDSNRLPVGAIESADIVATKLNQLSEETLQDALSAVHAEIENEDASVEMRA